MFEPKGFRAWKVWGCLTYLPCFKDKETRGLRFLRRTNKPGIQFANQNSGLHVLQALSMSLNICLLMHWNLSKFIFKWQRKPPILFILLNLLLSPTWTLVFCSPPKFTKHSALVRIYQKCEHAQSVHSCPALHDPKDCSPPGSSVHRFSRQLEWVAMPSSKISSQPRNQTLFSSIADRFFTTEPLGKPQKCKSYTKI